ncbi:hypothetical protein OAZ22_01975 [Pelagibacteraceae bacterium]|nr:hypothetical protein [Pelagibacteraceae bacterium]
MLKNLIYILTLKKIPELNWSSQFEYNLKPKKITIFYLIFGLILFGIGEALLITANIGVSPWFVLHQGLALKTDYTIGVTTFIVSVAVLILWFPLKQKPGIGTLLNAIFISIVIDLSLLVLPYPKEIFFQLIQVIIGILIIGIGSGYYLAANLGPGPRDGLMVGINKQTNQSITLIRTLLEITAVIVGFYLGGIVGVGTILYALLIGFSVSLGLFIIGKIYK